MASVEQLVNAFTTLLVTVDPPGLAPLFIGVTQGMSALQRRQVAIRSSLIAFGILTVFALFGASILSALGISMGAFRIAGGLMLFTIAFEMIFEKRQERKEKTGDAAITKDHIHNIAVFPLAIPLIAGPGAISATVLISGTMPETAGKAQLIAVIAVCLALVLAALLLADRLNRALGVTGRALLTRLLGVILAALSVQFVVDGIKAAFGL
ncbi:MarC family protein [Rhizobium sp. RU36D]|uniref:MarC family protein n=1 Tax=Rhizobium sp. RU36D TaxID=1907415 RepID=UPI0009D85EA8|nr:MarC family protein [Rhizobium sp. RU36D]SMC67884.1 multiple antibiotic resistance protein [Rhizobium sp. RU36D]